MTPEQILDDIRSERVKKAILDADAFNEMDDQYAIAYAIGCDKLDVLAINATLFYNSAKVESYEDGMRRSYDEIHRVLKLLGREDIPLYYGCGSTVTVGEDAVAQDSPAVDNMIKTVKESDEIIYILATGAATNVASALMKDPSIAENMCVVWLGGTCLGCDNPGAEFNLIQDMKAAQYVLNSKVNMVFLPALGDKGYGTQELLAVRRDLFENFTGNDEASTYFRETLPRECDGSFDDKPDTWWHIFWDIAAPAVFSCPDNLTLKVVNAPRIRNDGSIAENEPRHNIVYMERLDPAPIFADMFEKVNSIIK